VFTDQKSQFGYVFGGPWNGKCSGHLEYFAIVEYYILWAFGNSVHSHLVHFSPTLVYCAKKNLATLATTMLHTGLSLSFFISFDAVMQKGTDTVIESCKKRKKCKDQLFYHKAPRLCNVVGRVTRLVELSPFRWLFTLGIFSKLPKWPKILGYFFPQICTVLCTLILTKMLVGLHFGQLFLQSHLVTLAHRPDKIRRSDSFLQTSQKCPSRQWASRRGLRNCPGLPDFSW
jgi:hypothetical protein